MTAFPTLPEWLPWWVPILVMVPLFLYVLVFLAMPLGVFGVKGRLDVMEARLDEIQGEIRMLALRLPEPGRHADFRDLRPVDLGPYAERPPIPPVRDEPPQAPPRNEPPPRIVSRNEPPGGAFRNDSVRP